MNNFIGSQFYVYGANVKNIIVRFGLKEVRSRFLVAFYTNLGEVESCNRYNRICTSLL